MGYVPSIQSPSRHLRYLFIQPPVHQNSPGTTLVMGEVDIAMHFAGSVCQTASVRTQICPVTGMLLNQ